MPKKASKPREMSAEEFLRMMKEYGRASYSDEELLKAFLNEARRDVFQGVGRVFLNEFCKWYGCTPEHVLSILKASGLKWRYDPAYRIVYVEF